MLSGFHVDDVTEGTPVYENNPDVVFVHWGSFRHCPVDTLQTNNYNLSVCAAEVP